LEVYKHIRRLLPFMVRPKLFGNPMQSVHLC